MQAIAHKYFSRNFPDNLFLKTFCKGEFIEKRLQVTFNYLTPSGETLRLRGKDCEYTGKILTYKLMIVREYTWELFARTRVGIFLIWFNRELKALK